MTLEINTTKCIISGWTLLLRVLVFVLSCVHVCFLFQRELQKHLLSRALCLVVFPGLLYMLQFYILFTVARKTGPHDDMMSSAFQASLEVKILSADSTKKLLAGVTVESKTMLQLYWLWQGMQSK